MANSKNIAPRVVALNSRVQDSRLRGAWQREPVVVKPEEICPAVRCWSEMASLLFEAG